VGGGGTVQLADNTSREVGKTILRDGADTNIVQRLDDSGRIVTSPMGQLYDYFLPITGKKCVYRDDMALSPFGWNQVSGTLGASSAYQPISQPQVATLATAAGIGAVSEMSRYVPALSATTVRLFTYWSCYESTAGALRFMKFKVYNYSGGTLGQVELRYYKDQGGGAQDKWQYLDDTATWTDIASGSETLGSFSSAEVIWNYLLVDINFGLANPRITALRTNGLDLSGLTLDGQTSAVAGNTYRLAIETTADIAQITTGLVDYYALFEV
jgi:hypothetical protein